MNSQNDKILAHSKQFADDLVCSIETNLAIINWLQSSVYEAMEQLEETIKGSSDGTKSDDVVLHFILKDFLSDIELVNRYGEEENGFGYSHYIKDLKECLSLYFSGEVWRYTRGCDRMHYNGYLDRLQEHLEGKES